jgi:hypothetical protein
MVALLASLILVGLSIYWSKATDYSNVIVGYEFSYLFQ